MKDYFVFEKVNSLDYLMFIANKNQFEGGGKVVETIKIPGRTGTLSYEDGSFENVKISYKLYTNGDIRQNVNAFRNRLSSTSGYCRLADSYEPDIFMRARYVDKFTVDVSDRKNAGLTVNFDCDPRRFLKSGEIPYTVTSSDVMFNPTQFASAPLLRAYGTGTLTISGVSITITAADNYTDIDCELQEAYKGDVNCNANIILVDGEFPTMPAGDNEITMSGISRVEITPRWWTI